MNVGVWVMLAILLFNGGISWLNAVVCGQNWRETKAVGGWSRAVVWCGAVQSAVGFSSIFIVALVALASVTHVLPAAMASKAFSLWYLLVIVPALGTGIVVLIESWRTAYRERDLLSIGSAAYNSLAMWSNVRDASSGIGSAFKEVASLFKEDGDGELPTLSVIVFIIVLLALGAGILLTAGIIRAHMGTVPLPGNKIEAATV